MIYDPTGPMGAISFSTLIAFSEFEVTLLRLRTREGMAISEAEVRAPKVSAAQQAPASA